MTQPDIKFRKQVSSDCNKSEHPPTKPTEENVKYQKVKSSKIHTVLQQERKPVVRCVWLQETRLRGFLQTPLCCGRFRVSCHTCGRQALEGKYWFQEMMMSWQINIKTILTVWPSLHYFLELDSFLEEVWLSVCGVYVCMSVPCITSTQLIIASLFRWALNTKTWLRTRLHSSAIPHLSSSPPSPVLTVTASICTHSHPALLNISASQMLFNG